jgi:hypothetical protein
MTKSFRIWDSKTLQESSKIATQITSILNEVCATNQVNLTDLPPSLVPTEQLYLLAASFQAAYEKLINYELVSTGNLTDSRKNNIH